MYPPTPTYTHQSDEFSPVVSRSYFPSFVRRQLFDYSLSLRNALLIPRKQPQFAAYPGFNFVETSQPHQSMTSTASVMRPHTPMEPELQGPGDSGEDVQDKELTPGQARRKAQNRAAQRAFRERKERHVRELEQKLTSLEQAAQVTMTENDMLKQELEKIKMENRLLHENSLRLSPSEIPEMGPMAFKPTDHPLLQHHPSPPSAFTNPIFGAHPNRGPLHRITTSPGTGERLLGAGAAWDLIVCHPLYEQGLVDIGDISDRLKGLARCDGQGPVFEERVILEAIQASSGSGQDDLLLEGSAGGIGY
ncbi:AP-1-like transcription factor [Rhizina undulata]